MFQYAPETLLQNIDSLQGAQDTESKQYLVSTLVLLKCYGIQSRAIHQDFFLAWTCLRLLELSMQSWLLPWLQQVPWTFCTAEFEVDNIITQSFEVSL